jgi:hypothetical protein
VTVLRVVCCGQIVLWSAASRKKKPAPLLGAMYRRGLVHARVVYATLIHRDDCAVAARVSPRPSIARGGACRHAAAGSVAQKEARAAAGLTRARDSLWLTIPVRMIIAMLREVAGDYPLDAVAGAMMSQLIAAASQSAHITSRLSRNRPSLIVFR